MPEPLVKDWELYSTSMKCGRAKKALDAVLNKAVKKMIADIKKRKLRAGDNESIGVLIADLRTFVMYPVMKKYEEFGACDTEPYFNAGQGLINAAKDYFGIPRCRSVEWGEYL